MKAKVTSTASVERGKRRVRHAASRFESADLGNRRVRAASVALMASNRAKAAGYTAFDEGNCYAAEGRRYE